MPHLKDKHERGLRSKTIAIGIDPLKALTTGIDNIAIGTSVADAVTTGICNVALGANALGASTTGCQNVAIGNLSSGGCTLTGTNNVTVGYGGGFHLTSGEYNTFLGYQTGGKTTTGSGNIGIGTNAGCSTTTQGCTINIGNGMQTTTASTTCIGGACLMSACFVETSDCRSKCKIKDLPYGLNFINLLRPVSYKWKPQPDKLDKNGNLIEEGEKSHTGPRTSFGLLGQEVKGALDKLGLGYNDFGAYSDKVVEHGPSGWTPSYQEEDKTIGLSYVGFVAPLIKAVQELSAEVTELKAQLKTA